MSEKEFPRRSPMGAQLAIGVKSAAQYVPSDGNLESNQHRWAEVYDDQLEIDLSKLRISTGRCLVEDLTRSATHKNQMKDDDYLLSDEDDVSDEGGEHQKEVIVPKLSWDSLSPILPSNFQYFKNVEFRREHMYDVKSKPNSPHDFVPGSLITDLARSDLVSSGQVGNNPTTKGVSSFDPTVGPLFITGEVQTIPDLRNNVQPHRIMVYCSGKANSILNIAVVDREREINTASLTFDQIKSSTSIEMMSSIKSIKITNLSAMLGRKGDLIGVMTEGALHIIKIENVSAHHEIRTSLCEPVPFKEFGDFPFADFAFNPWDLRQFAVVDVRGNFGLGQMPKSFKIGSKCQFSNDHLGTIFDSEELSNWKRIEWSSSFTRLLVMDRSKLVELDFAHDWQLEVIQAKTWSRLLDYHRLDDDYGILLTSREIIVISTQQNSEQLTREVSWKHDLNPNDTTPRLCVQAIQLNGKKMLLICIFSRNHSQLYIHCFSLNGQEILIQSGGTPVLLQVPHVTDGLNGICLYDRAGDDESEFSAPNSQASLQLSLFVNENGSRKFWHYVVTNDNLPISQNKIWQRFNSENNGATCQNNLDLPIKIPSILARIYPSTLKAADSNVTADSESEVFQAYGYQLSEAINKILLTWENSPDFLAHLQASVQDLAVVPSSIYNLSELTSLLQQLSDHYTEQGLKFTSFKSISSMLLQETAEDLDLFYNKLLQCWDLVTSNSEALTRGVIRDAVISALQVFKPSKYKEAEEMMVESLSETYRDVIDSWAEEEFPADISQGSTSVFSQSQLPQGSQSQIPTIKASQTRSIKRNKRRAIGISSGKVSKISNSQPLFNKDNVAAPPLLSSSQLPNTLPETMTPAFSLLQSAGSFSQSQSSQRSKRKKKRVGGFG